MSTPLIVNGVLFNYPQTGDESWGTAATGWAQAVTSGMLQKSGGFFLLTALVDFGPNFGIKVKSIATETANPSTAGYMALAKSDSIGWRNNANSGNLLLSVDGSDNLTFNGSALGLTSLANAEVYVGNVSNVPTAVALSGDATLANTGALTIANSAITNAKVSATAAIALSKLAALGTSKAVQTNSGTGFLEASNVTNTELGYLSGVTSAIQTQIGTLLPLIGGTMSGAINMGSHKITSLSDGSASADAVAYHQLRILQIVFATSSTQATTAGSTFANTNLTASITPSSSSNKVLVLAMGTIQAPSTKTVYATLTNATSGNLGGSSGLADFFATGGGATGHAPCFMMYLDSPATTSARTYLVQIKNDDGASTVAFGQPNQTQTMILMEVA